MKVLVGHLSNEKMNDLVGAFYVKDVDNGNNIIKQGDEGDRLYIVDEGNVDIFVARKDAPAPGDKVLSLGSGALFGELALMYNAPRAATVTATSAVKAFVLDAIDFKMLLAQSTQATYTKYEGWLSSVELLSSLVISAAKTAINAGLKVALGAMDPWNYNIRNTSLELPLWGCTLKVNAETDLRVSGLGSVNVPDLQCMQSECVEDGWVGCAKYEHTLSATVNLGVLTLSGSDRSLWECGMQLPERNMSLSWEMHNYGMRADFKLNHTMLPPEGNVTEVLAVNTQLGESKNHKCTIQGVELGFLCGPQLEMITRVVQNALKDVIDPVILQLLNYVLVPPTEETAKK